MGEIIMKANVLVGLALAGLMGLTACATSEDIVPVPYTASSAPATPGAQNIHVTVASSDARTENRARIGAQINGYGMEMAAIRSQVEVTEIVRDAIAAELRQRGYQVSETGSRVNAEVTTFYNDFSTGLLAGKSKADVALTVTVTDKSGVEVYRRGITGEAERTVQLANGGNAATTLSQALSKALEQLMSDPAFVAALAR
ncbi:MAG: YajG family lipoprotein [Alphaproteobacteria bacterium]|nr:YajG family lipoprotein [Alphaproteobacteria bacterium]MBU2163735.1 YajG family lipoprotein [Alphaproteobacteria bacterium]MBU2230760.1 YajG family lipoprotein [Alphaproteobacteria bacterium]MBU2347894.1 YajG family lipoprotein [Alphaproteobacteria bacterium]MBU2400596.1 YajG family lipoprotein [Alphaproteobacteria bacterium]